MTTFFTKLTADEAKAVKAFDKDLAAIQKTTSVYDRQLRRDIQEELRKTASDISDVKRAILAAVELGKSLSCEKHSEAEASAITGTLWGIRDSINRGPLAELLKPIFRRAKGAAEKQAAEMEEEERREAKALRFPYARSAKVNHLQQCVKNLDRLGGDPAPSTPFGDLLPWLEKRGVES